MFPCRWRSFLGLALLGLAFTGCGGARSVKVNGKILKDGKPMVVSEDTYVTLSFMPDAKQGDTKATSYSAKFDPKSGTYSLELPPGQYRTMLVIALPLKGKAPPGGKINALPPIKSELLFDLTKSQELDVEVPAR